MKKYSTLSNKEYILSNFKLVARFNQLPDNNKLFDKYHNYLMNNNPSNKCFSLQYLYKGFLMFVDRQNAFIQQNVNDELKRQELIEKHKLTSYVNFAINSIYNNTCIEWSKKGYDHRFLNRLINCLCLLNVKDKNTASFIEWATKLILSSTYNQLVEYMDKNKDLCK